MMNQKTRQQQQQHLRHKRVLAELDEEKSRLEKELQLLIEKRTKIATELREFERTQFITAYKCISEPIKNLLSTNSTERDRLFFECMICKDSFPRSFDELSDEHAIGNWFDKWELRFPECKHSCCRICYPRLLCVDGITYPNRMFVRCPICRPNSYYYMTVQDLEFDEPLNLNAFSNIDDLHITTQDIVSEEFDDDDDDDTDEVV
jgi:hypothetical protein